MIKKLLVLSLLASSLQACAENPEKLVAAKPDPKNGNLPVTGQPVKANAIHFEGLDLNDDPCGLFLTFHDGSWMVKLDYKLHGETFPDMSVSEYDYDSATKNYDKLSSTGINHTPVLAAALLSDPDAIVDLNKLADYRSTGTLTHSMQVNLDSNLTFAEFEHFEEAVIDIEADATKFATHQSDLNAVNSITFRLKHGNHYDTMKCTGLVAHDVDEVEFSDVVGGDDDHDHDHDHGDDHGDDHADDDHDHDHDDDHVDDPVVVNP
jgi:hypothetical protein